MWRLSDLNLNMPLVTTSWKIAGWNAFLRYANRIMKLAVHATGKNLKMFSAHFKHFKIAISQILLTFWWNTISSCNSLCKGSPQLRKIHYPGPHLRTFYLKHVSPAYPNFAWIFKPQNPSNAQTEEISRCTLMSAKTNKHN